MSHKSRKTRVHHHLVVRTFTVFSGHSLTKNVRSLGAVRPFDSTQGRILRATKTIAVKEATLSSILPLSPDAITRLQDRRLIRLPRPARAKRLPIDYAALQQSYARMLAEGPFSNQTELARHLGVSRIWVSRVLKGIKRKVG